MTTPKKTSDFAALSECGNCGLTASEGCDRMRRDAGVQLDDAGRKALRMVLAVAFTAIGCALLAWMFAGGAK